MSIESKLSSSSEALHQFQKVAELSLEPAELEKLVLNLMYIALMFLSVVATQHSRSLHISKEESIHASGLLKSYYQAIAPFAFSTAFGLFFVHNMEVQNQDIINFFMILGVVLGMLNYVTVSEDGNIDHLNSD